MRLKPILALALCALLPGAAAAQAVPDAAAAQMLAGPCANCHGPDGHSPGAIPSIAGLPADEAREKLLVFRDGSAPATVMTRLMKGYDEAQIGALAAWFAEVNP
ncbi:MAG: hypothetical protein Q4G49_18095 [Paracoccus sp. (in: a-proteobacteria)]|nr:hypothetical protein [Paracoccus sp. (in: a-proteobacteria)]